MDLKQVSTLFAETIAAEMARYDLAIQDLQNRVFKLENSERVFEQEPVVPPGIPLRVKQQPAEGAIKAYRIKYAVFIVQTLLQNQKEGKDLNTLTELLRAQFPRDRLGVKSTTTILEGLIKEQLVRAILISKTKKSYNVPVSKVQAAREWALSNTPTENLGEVTPPPEVVEFAILDEGPKNNFTMRFPSGDVRTLKRARDLKAEARERGLQWRWANDRLAHKYSNTVKPQVPHYKSPTFR